MFSKEAENARKDIAEALKASACSVGHLWSYARYATHIRKFSPAAATTEFLRNKIARNNLAS
jgi:hypothetical protein